jgi:DNA-binding response OmpR family regulator
MTDEEASTILVVEDDDATRTFLADNLIADGYEVLVADCAADALRLLETKFPDVVLLDIGLPDVSGLDLLRRAREADGVASRINPAVPVVVLSGRASELDRVRAFEAGADDFVAKPFSYGELRLRVGALLRRMEPSGRSVRVRVGDLEVDATSREVLLRGRRIELSQKEFALLRTLASAPTKVWTKQELLRTVWGFRSVGATRTLDSHACRLRQKLGVDGDRLVVNVWGVGYRLVDPAPVADPLRPASRAGRFTVAAPQVVA